MPELSALAMSVLALEGGHSTSEQIAVSADRACERLMSQLSRLVGVGGSESLIGLSLDHTRATVPWLTAERGNAEGPWLGLRAALVTRSTSEATEAFATWLSIVLEILTRFIGASLMLIVLHESWPDVFPRPPKELT